MTKYIVNPLVLFLAVVLLTTVLFSFLNPVVATMTASEDDLTTYFAEGGVLTAYEDISGEFSQIGIQWGEHTDIITDERFAHVDPQVFGHQVVWSAQKGSQWQIFLYDALAQDTQQLTFTGNNTNPQISEAGIVWEGQSQQSWVIKAYRDGKVITLSEPGLVSQDVQLSGELVAYTQKSPEYGWQVHVYNLNTQQRITATPDSSSYKPTFANGQLRWQIPLFENGVAWGQMDLTNQEVIVADTPAELDEVYTFLSEDASASAELETAFGSLDDSSLLESLQVLGVIDETGRVVEK